MITMVLNGNTKINVWFWLIMFNIWCPFWLLVTCFDPLGWLMAHPLRFANLGIMLHIKLGSMGTRRFIQWITLWLLIKSKFVHVLKLYIYKIRPWCHHIALVWTTSKLTLNFYEWWSIFRIFVGGPWIFKWGDVHHE
jgi:hypothetical protein